MIIPVIIAMIDANRPTVNACAWKISDFKSKQVTLWISNSIRSSNDYKNKYLIFWNNFNPKQVQLKVKSSEAGCIWVFCT